MSATPTKTSHRRYTLKKPMYVLACGIVMLMVNHSQAAYPPWLDTHCPGCSTKMSEKTGVYILDYGEDSLLSRAWLARNASHSIDIQYFIWSTDNIGILASAELLDAANRGVKVRVLVDDLLIDAEDKTLLALNAHKNVSIRIYNPQHSVGVSGWQRAWGLLSNFRKSNQRMHDKTAIFDGVAGITGGRNMADEYYDFDHHYNFRDRDVLLLGAAVRDMSANFEEFWNADLAIPVEAIFASDEQQLNEAEIFSHHKTLIEYANNAENFAPEVRTKLQSISTVLPSLAPKLVWDDVNFISDIPGKNHDNDSLKGGGEATEKLLNVLRGAQQSILIQSPYLIVPEGGIELFSDLIKRGIRIRISTNSLASTDNLMAFSGYYKQRDALLAAGVDIYEFRPDAQIRTTLIERRETSNTIFALHAKSLLVDGDTLFIGTFNLDPRSANLNTEVGILVKNSLLGEQLAKSIEADIQPENSWKISPEFNPDHYVARSKRLQLWLYSLLPMNAIL